MSASSECDGDSVDTEVVNLARNADALTSNAEESSEIPTNYESLLHEILAEFVDKPSIPETFECDLDVPTDEHKDYVSELIEMSSLTDSISKNVDYQHDISTTGLVVSNVSIDVASHQTDATTTDDFINTPTESVSNTSSTDSVASGFIDTITTSVPQEISMEAIDDGHGGSFLSFGSMPILSDFSEGTVEGHSPDSIAISSCKTVDSSKNEQIPASGFTSNSVSDFSETTVDSSKDRQILASGFTSHSVSDFSETTVDSSKNEQIPASGFTSNSVSDFSEATVDIAEYKHIPASSFVGLPTILDFSKITTDSAEEKQTFSGLARFATVTDLSETTVDTNGNYTKTSGSTVGSSEPNTTTETVGFLSNNNDSATEICTSANVNNDPNAGNITETDATNDLHESGGSSNNGRESWTKSMLRCLVLASCVSRSGSKNKKLQCCLSKDSSSSSDCQPSTNDSGDTCPKKEEESALESSPKKEPSGTARDLTVAVLKPLTKMNCDMALANVQHVSTEYYTRCFENNHLNTLMKELVNEYEKRMFFKRVANFDLLNFPAYFRLKQHIGVVRRVMFSYRLLHRRLVTEAVSIMADKHYLQDILENMSQFDSSIVDDVNRALCSMNIRMGELSACMEENHKKYELFFIIKEKIGLYHDLF